MGRLHFCDKGLWPYWISCSVIPLLLLLLLFAEFVLSDLSIPLSEAFLWRYDEWQTQLCASKELLWAALQPPAELCKPGPCSCTLYIHFQYICWCCVSAHWTMLLESQLPVILKLYGNLVWEQSQSILWASSFHKAAFNRRLWVTIGWALSVSKGGDATVCLDNLDYPCCELFSLVSNGNFSYFNLCPFPSTCTLIQPATFS